MKVIQAFKAKHNYFSNFFRFFGCTNGKSLIQSLNDLSNRSTGVSIIVSKVNSIHFNLAFEHYLMDCVRPKIPVFLYWRNDKNVVIGRCQNPWKECNLTSMKENKVTLARRFSGGGAVYQDLGNSCFTFLIPSDLYDKDKNNKIILSVLKNEFGIIGEASGRNDLVVNGQKFSGAAFKHINASVSDNGVNHGLSLHHGTILINTDLQALQKYLTPSKLKLMSKGITSVKSRVVNLSTISKDISHESLQTPLINNFKKMYSTGEYDSASDEIIEINAIFDVNEIAEFKKVYSLLTDWNWLFGQTFDYTHQIERHFSWGNIDLELTVKKGIIERAKLYTDSIHTDFVTVVETHLTNCCAAADDINNCLDSIQIDSEEAKKAIYDIKSAIVEDICVEKADY